MPEPGASAITKHSLTIAGHRTSISLESAFWDALRDIARARDLSLAALIGKIDAGARYGESVVRHPRLCADAVSRFGSITPGGTCDRPVPAAIARRWGDLLRHVGLIGRGFCARLFEFCSGSPVFSRGLCLRLLLLRPPATGASDRGSPAAPAPAPPRVRHPHSPAGGPPHAAGGTAACSTRPHVHARRIPAPRSAPSRGRWRARRAH